MKYLTFKEVHQILTAHESFDMNDFINAYLSKEIKIRTYALTDSKKY